MAPQELPSLRLIEGVVAPEIIKAAKTASKALTQQGVRHALIGGLAVGGYGYPRATKDVDFLVGEEAFDVHGGGLVTFRPGIPIAVKDVVIDLLEDDEIPEEELESPADMGGLPVVSVGALVILKLKAWRRRDQQDIEALVRAGSDVAALRDYLKTHAPGMRGLMDRLDTLVEQADVLEERPPRRARRR
jgi:hypothetical protein